MLEETHESRLGVERAVGRQPFLRSRILAQPSGQVVARDYIKPDRALQVPAEAGLATALRDLASRSPHAVMALCAGIALIVAPVLMLVNVPHASTIYLAIAAPAAYLAASGWVLKLREADQLPQLHAALQWERRRRRLLKTELSCLRARRTASELREQAEMSRLHAALQESYRRLMLALSSAGIGYFEVENVSGAMTCSPRVASMLRLRSQEMPTSREAWLEHVHPDDRALLEWPEKGLERGFRPMRLEYRLRRGDDTYVWVRDSLIAASSDGHSPRRMVGTLTDISSQKKTEERLAQQVFRDHLTGLGNRAAFDHELARALRQTSSTRPTALILIDLDFFKCINDTGGHPAGDACLVEIARRLRLVTGERDKVHRLGGDEFAVIASDRAEAQGYETVAQRIQNALGISFLHAQRTYSVAASVGFAVFTEPLEPGDAVGRADSALYNAKSKGRGRAERWTSTINIKKKSRKKELKRKRAGIAAS